MVSTVIPVQPFDLVIFGATGDLAHRKILPSLYRRLSVHQMPQEARIIGAARSKMSRAEFRKSVQGALEEFVEPGDLSKERVEAFLATLDYVTIDAAGDGGWAQLARKLDEKPDHIRAFYLSVAPSLFGTIAGRLTEAGITTPSSRIVVEKPLGQDLASARALNAQLSRHFGEHQIYRIDHYLGKETVQNLMAIRFANALFEPLWNSRYVEHVQITVAETVGVAGRGAYYDGSGAMRDMVQNHIMQLLCLTAMEPPAKFDPDAVRDEKLKVIRALDPLMISDTVRGQYRANGKDGSYLDHVGNPASRTESFVAIRAHVSNWRWAGTPFYLRTGKKLAARLSEIVVTFKHPPHTIFPQVEAQKGNALIIRLQPDEGITMRVTIKEPGPGGMRLVEVPLDMTFADALGEEGAMPEAYERLIMDVIRGDQTLFMRGDEVEAAWAWTDPIIQFWKESGSRPLAYDSGGAGPIEAYKLTSADGHLWREIVA
ncbi:glucose-6-phosphate dehydrogenase [Amaricoccus sp.]|uniref:glucose-6-phosphate dehydrogenase n=1 Tax=Amaricoccus sp. TaxID=1872485 RepID=UPI001DC4ACA4|nr:glucose-6-phosphate dehydrogenase [Amaricoccus sp.]MCB1370206.1 glucose-6-phosphate dehydrogenase [Paracoccaceae bacterium]HRW14275.1 glucose-6-phosphate dehydrogenase [Amaricoccus sp.]